MKTKTHVIHAVFSCYDCDKRWEDWRTARKKAYEHAKSTGHKVIGETATAVTYNT